MGTGLCLAVDETEARKLFAVTRGNRSLLPHDHKSATLWNAINTSLHLPQIVRPHYLNAP